jgi:hypothetical protein
LFTDLRINALDLSPIDLSNSARGARLGSSSLTVRFASVPIQTGSSADDCAFMAIIIKQLRNIASFLPWPSRDVAKKTLDLRNGIAVRVDAKHLHTSPPQVFADILSTYLLRPAGNHA